MSMMPMGCIDPAPIFEADESNNPLWIVEDQVAPPIGKQVVVDRLSSVQNFEIKEILDKDVNDTIHVRWFLDYFPGIQYPDELAPNGSRRRQASYSIDFCAPSPIRDEPEARVLVEAVVADRDFVAGTLRQVPEAGSSRTVLWVLELKGVCQEVTP